MYVRNKEAKKQGSKDFSLLLCLLASLLRDKFYEIKIYEKPAMCHCGHKG